MLLFKLSDTDRLYWKTQLRDAKEIFIVLLLSTLVILPAIGFGYMVADMQSQGVDQVHTCELYSGCKKMPNYFLDALPGK